jgi:Ca-activated chloride channel family protein
MIGRRTLVAAAFAAGLLPPGPPAQQVFRAGTDVVWLNVTVTDASGHLVPGLDRADFQVFEDNVPQEVSIFARDPQPIALSMLIDSSSSMDAKIGVAQQAAIGFAGRLGDHDVARVIDFDSRVEILQSYTHDREALDTAIRRTLAGGRTSLYDAIYIALSTPPQADTPASDEIRRQAIVVLSDGEDTSSLNASEDVLDLSKRAGMTVYAIGLRSKADAPLHGFNQAEFFLRALSQETGGRTFFVEDVAQLPAVYSQIADELANQYTLGYKPRNMKHDGAWRRISVRVGRGAAAARTKSGYFSPTRAR